MSQIAIERRLNMIPREMGGVVGADREVRAGGSEEPRGIEHDPRDSGVVARVERGNPPGHRDRVERDARMIVLTDESQSLLADRPVTKRRSLRAARDDANVSHAQSLARSPVRAGD